MSSSTILQQKDIQKTKCTKCGRRTATREDHLCDTCRFEQTLDNIVKKRQE